jgi:ribosomal protein S6--L-glutamate ligase
LFAIAAKVDTGARTSALHVQLVGAPGVGLAAADGRAEIEVVLPEPTAAARAGRVVSLAVEDWIEVRDTSGRRERRPVVKTPLELGPLRRIVRLTLTHRGDMRYPMLVGRTALAPGVLVDPAARFLLAPSLVAPWSRRQKI